MYIKQATESFIEWKASYATKAAINYKLHLTRFGEFLKNKRVKEITLTDVVHFIEQLKIKYSPANVSYSIIVVKNFMRFCSAYRWTSFDHMLIHVPKFVAKTRTVVTEEDYLKMVGVFKDDEFHHLTKKLCIEILWQTGMRVSELCDLNISDIETDKHYTAITTKKNRQQRWVMWSKDTHSKLLKYLGVRLCLNSKPALFITSAYNSKERITPRTVQRWIRQATVKAKISKLITPHSFRHGKAHNMLMKGANVKEIQLVLGHSEHNPSASFSYLRLDMTEFKSIANRYL